MEKWIEKFNALSIGEKIILPAGVVLFIIGFLPWYSVDLGPLGTYTRNGWESPGAIWSILAIFVGLAMAVVVGLKAFSTVAIPDNVGGFTWPKIHLGGGVLALVLVLIKFLNDNRLHGVCLLLGHHRGGGARCGWLLDVQGGERGLAGALQTPYAPFIPAWSPDEARPVHPRVDLPWLGEGA